MGEEFYNLGRSYGYELENSNRYGQKSGVRAVVASVITLTASRPIASVISSLD